MDRKAHWNQIYATRPLEQVGWYQPHNLRTLALIDRLDIPPSSQVIDVGGGAATLVDDLLARGFTNVTVLDVSDAALRLAQTRLGTRADSVTWLTADITQVTLPREIYDLWLDRAVFHFLVDADDRQRYVEVVKHAQKPGGTAIIATFALDGPSSCSGLPVARYDAAELREAFGTAFTLVTEGREMHVTPSGAEQAFTYAVLRYVPRLGEA